MPVVTTLKENSSPEETALIRGLRRGDEESFETLVRTFGARMLAVARRIVRDEEEARDAVQDAFLQAARSIQRFRADAKLATWLHRIVVNAALMRLRRAERREEVAIEDLLPAFDAEGALALAHGEPVSLETAVAATETRETVRRCIGLLPESYRVVLMLRDIEELDTAETAAMIGITRDAVKLRLHRARQALATLLAGAMRGGGTPARAALRLS